MATMVAGQLEEDRMEDVIKKAEEVGIQWDELTPEQRQSLYRDYTGEEISLEKLETMANANRGGTTAGDIYVADSPLEGIASVVSAYKGKKARENLSKDKAMAYETAGGLAAGQAQSQMQHQLALAKALRGPDKPPGGGEPQPPAAASAPPPGVAGPPPGVAGPPSGPTPVPPTAPTKAQFMAENQNRGGGLPGVPPRRVGPKDANVLESENVQMSMGLGMGGGPTQFMNSVQGGGNAGNPPSKQEVMRATPPPGTTGQPPLKIGGASYGPSPQGVGAPTGAPTGAPMGSAGNPTAASNQVAMMAAEIRKKKEEEERLRMGQGGSYAIQTGR